MNNLLEHILNGDYVSANDLFEERMVELQERKLYEAKRMIQSEVFGGLTLAQIQARKELGWKKAADVLGDPRERAKHVSTRFAPAKKKVKVRKKLKEAADPTEVAAEKERLRRAGKAYPEYQSKETPSSEPPRNMPNLKGKKDYSKLSNLDYMKARKAEVQAAKERLHKRTQERIAKDPAAKARYQAAKNRSVLKGITKGPLKTIGAVGSVLSKANQIKRKIDSKAGEIAGHFGTSAI